MQTRTKQRTINTHTNADEVSTPRRHSRIEDASVRRVQNDDAPMARNSSSRLQGGSNGVQEVSTAQSFTVFIVCMCVCMCVILCINGTQQ